MHFIQKSNRFPFWKSPVLSQWDLNAACDTMFFFSLCLMKCSSTGPHSTRARPLKVLKLFSTALRARWALDQSLQDEMLQPSSHFRCCSLLNSGRVVGASCLDDLWPRGAGLVVLVAVVGGGAVTTLVLTDVDNHARGGGRGRVELVLLPWDSHKTWPWFADLVQPQKFPLNELLM